MPFAEKKREAFNMYELTLSIDDVIKLADVLTHSCYMCTREMKSEKAIHA